MEEMDVMWQFAGKNKIAIRKSKVSINKMSVKLVDKKVERDNK